MRRFIRHPSKIPINVSLREPQPHASPVSLVNVSRGGLCFYSSSEIDTGKCVEISIHVDRSPFQCSAEVVWCHPYHEQYFVGVCFPDEATEYSIRMVEQVCYVEQYRITQLDREGRDITSEQAAKEWIELYAADFPKH